ncbi:MAG: ABC transporter permease, partial [Acidimicrobiales bacterium]
MTVAVADPHEVQIGVQQALEQARALARRSIVGTVRQPQVWLPGLLFPMFIAAVNTSTMGRSTAIPGFPEVDSLLDFLLPASITQSVLFGGLTAGSDTATDIQTGFFDRLLASPVSRTSILVGRLTGAAVTGALQAVIFMVVYGAFGVRLAGGVAAALVLIVYAMVLA